MTGDGTCEPVEGVSADTVRPLGSGFKLYVLGALARAVRTGRASWDQQLAIVEDERIKAATKAFGRAVAHA